MKVKKTNSAYDGSKTTSEIDLFEGRTLTSAMKKKIADEVGEFLVEETLDSLASNKSPVAGNPYEGSLTSDKYKKRKKALGLGSTANLEAQGDLTDSLTFKRTKSGVEIGHFNKSQGLKADGHNNFSGQSNLPKRQYLPDEKTGYNQRIANEVKRITERVITENTVIPKDKFRRVESKSEFWSILKTIFQNQTRSEIRNNVTMSAEWTQYFIQRNFIKWLK